MPQSQRHLDGNVCLDFINNPAELTGGGDGLAGSSEDPGRVQRFRAALQRILTAEAQGAVALPGDLAVLNRVLRRAGARRGLVPTVRGYGWGWLDGTAGPEQLLWPVAFSAARLLEGPGLARLKSCSGCGQLFLDASRNRSRRWCDMDGCGNREKQRRRREGK
jgi:predicted RNA-binding Zn ribbon-like protein